MSIILGGKDSKLNFCSHHNNRTQWLSGWSSTCSECQKAGRVDALITVRELGKYAEGHKIRCHDRRLI